MGQFADKAIRKSIVALNPCCQETSEYISVFVFSEQYVTELFLRAMTISIALREPSVQWPWRQTHF